MFTRNFKSAALVIFMAVLSACGGGGAADTTAPPVQMPPPVVTVAANLQTSVAAPAYAAGSEELVMFNTVNTARAGYGVGLVSDNTKLAQAASSYTGYQQGQWLAGNFTEAAHTETIGKPGFTGATAADRITSAGFSAAATGEVMATFVNADNVVSSPGQVAVNTLLSGPYHRFALFDSFREMGVGRTAYRFGPEGGVTNFFVADFGTAPGAGEQLPAAGWVGVWPLDSATGVQYAFAGEVPNPIPVIGTACGGYPVSLQVRKGDALTTTAFTMSETVSGAAVPVQLSTHATDRNQSFARANTAYIIPLSPLKLATKYTVHFTGADGVLPLDKTWTFTTVTQNNKAVYGCDPS